MTVGSTQSVGCGCESRSWSKGWGSSTAEQQTPKGWTPQSSSLIRARNSAAECFPYKEEVVSAILTVPMICRPISGSPR